MDAMFYWDGFYAAYMTGDEGQGFAMFIFSNGTIVGADPLGVRFDGSFEVTSEGALRAAVEVNVPPEGMVIQGATPGPSGLSYGVSFDLSQGQTNDYFQITTPLGPVNVRLEKLRSI